MAKLTLLKIVQNVMSAMEADNVSSIDETIESLGIARIAEETYYEMIAQGDWPHLQRLKTLVSLGDSSHPNYLGISDDIQVIKSLSYNGIQLIYKTQEEFILFLNDRDLSESNVVEIIDTNNVSLKIINDQAPTYFTVVNDDTVITDSYDSTEDTTLVGSKSVVSATTIPSWTEDDSFIPDLTANMFPTYLAMVKRAAFLYYRREVSSKDERFAMAGLSRLYRQESKLNNLQSIKNYGRNK